MALEGYQITCFADSYIALWSDHMFCWLIHRTLLPQQFSLWTHGSPGSALLASLPVPPQRLPAKQHCQDPNSQHSWIPVSSCHPTPARGSSPHPLWDLGPASLLCPSDAVEKAPFVYLPWGIALPQGGSASHPYFLKNLFIKLIKLPNWYMPLFPAITLAEVRLHFSKLLLGHKSETEQVTSS